MASFKCSDLGRECCFEINAKNKWELQKQVISHLHDSHKIEVLPSDIMLQVKNSIRP